MEGEYTSFCVLRGEFARPCRLGAYLGRGGVLDEALPMRAADLAVRSTLAVALVACGSGGSTNDPPSAAPDAALDAGGAGEDGGALSDGGDGSGDCPAFGAPEALATVTDPALREVSGLVASERHPDVLFAHNDSGDVARLFALRLDATVAAAITVDGAEATDWEAIARGPAAGGPGLYIGDIGDNAQTRASVTVYVVPEPDLTAASVKVERRVDLRYEDGPHDAEALVVDPADGTIAVVTKAVASPGVYVADGGVLRKKGVLSFGAAAGLRLVTDASVSRSGDRILVRTYGSAHLYRRKAGEPLYAALLSAPCSVPFANEPQGEAIAFAFDGRGYYTLSENAGQPLYFFRAR